MAAKKTGNVGPDGLKYSTGVNLSGFDPSFIASNFDDIDVRNGSEKFHFSKTGQTGLDKYGNVTGQTVTPAVAAKQKTATVKSIFTSPLVIVGGIAVIGIVGIMLIKRQ